MINSVKVKKQGLYCSQVCQNNQGFTLIEVALVILVMAIIMGIAIPHLSVNKVHLARQEAVRFRNVIERISDQAAYSGGIYRLRINFTEQAYETLVLSEDEYISVSDPLLNKYSINPQGLTLKWVSYETYDTIDELDIDFSPFGPQIPILVEFSLNDKNSEGYSVLFVPGQRTPEIFQGRKTWNDFNRG